MLYVYPAHLFSPFSINEIWLLQAPSRALRRLRRRFWLRWSRGAPKLRASLQTRAGHLELRGYEDVILACQC